VERERRKSNEWLLLLCILTFGLIPLLVSAAAAVAVSVPPLSVALAAERGRSGTPGAIASDSPLVGTIETPTSTATAMRTPTRTPTPTATSRTPVTRSPVLVTPTFTRTMAPTRTPTATPCPPLQARLDARAGRDNRVQVAWTWTGGCGSVSGAIAARYVNEPEPYRTYTLVMNRRGLTDSPPPRCEGTFRIVYTLSLRDEAGHTASRTAQSSVTWIC